MIHQHQPVAEGPQAPIHFTTFDQVESKVVQFAYKKHIARGMLTMVIGRPGQGKSLFTSALTAEMTTDDKDPMTGEVTRKGEVVIFSNREDDPSYVTRPRLEGAGADLSKVLMVDFGMLPAGIETLRQAIIQTKASMVIIDPIAAHLEVSINNDQQVRKAMSPLTALATETNCAIVLVHHAKKGMSKKAHPLDAIGGASGGVTGACRAILAFGATDDMGQDDRIMVGIKCNFTEMPKGITFNIDTVDLPSGAEIGRLLVTQEDVDVDAMEVLAGSGKQAAPTEEAAPKKAMAAEWLTTQFANGPVKVELLKAQATAEGLSWRTIRRAAEVLEVDKQRHGFGPGSYISWNLPQGHPHRKEGGGN